MTSRRYSDALQFQQRTTETATSGQVTESWSLKFRRFGRVMQTGATEAERGNQKQQDEDYAIELPLDAEAGAVTARDWRVIWNSPLGDVTLNLTGVDTTGSGRQVLLLLRARRDR